MKIKSFFQNVTSLFIFSFFLSLVQIDGWAKDIEPTIPTDEIARINELFSRVWHPIWVCNPSI